MQNSGTLISSAIRPNDSLDQIASAFANEIKGGSHGYETYDDMNNIIVARREWGMLVTVYNDSDSDLNGTYQLRYEYSSDDILDNSNWFKTSISNINSNKEWVDSVRSILLVEPTLEPFLGHRYLLGTTSSVSPIGTQWDNIDATTIVEYNINGTWNITYPTNGMTVRVDNDNNSMYKYQGTFPSGIWKKEKITQVFYIEPTSISGLTYSVSTDPIFDAYSNDLIFLTKFNTANNGTASININGLGYKDIKIATKNGVRDLIITDIITNGIYSLTYNGTYFQMTKPFPSDAYNIQYYISPGEFVTVEEHEQYWVYGDLTIDGGVMQNYGHVVVANGSVNLLNGGTFSLNGSGELILVDLTNTITYNQTDTIQLSSDMTVNGPSVSAIVLNNSLTPSHINSVNTATASWILSNDGNGSFQWVLPTSGGLDINSDLFYNLDTVVSATDSTSAIYRTGSINIGTGTASDSRFVVSSSGGTVSLVVDELGNIYSYNLFGNSNTNFGLGALKSNIPSNSVTGTENSAFGTGALSLNTTGYGNSAFGLSSLLNCISSVANSAFGVLSLFSNNGGDSNSAFGYWSLKENTTGDNNCAFGILSLSDNRTGSNNIAIGYYSLTGNDTGSNNIAIGTSAARFIAGTTSSPENLNNSIFIGNNTRPSLENNINEIVIGATALGNGSNTVTLGNDNITKTYLKGNVQLPTVPTTSTGTYSILTRNDITGEVEKIVVTPYKVYTATLTRTGATGPSAVVLENTIGTITFSYQSTGIYDINSTSLFTLDKTVVFIQQNPDGTFANHLGASRINSNQIQITQTTSSGTNDESWGFPVSIEIRVYN
jgi:hypothetical protein